MSQESRHTKNIVASPLPTTERCRFCGLTFRPRLGVFRPTPRGGARRSVHTTTPLSSQCRSTSCRSRTAAIAICTNWRHQKSARCRFVQRRRRRTIPRTSNRPKTRAPSVQWAVAAVPATLVCASRIMVLRPLLSSGGNASLQRGGMWWRSRSPRSILAHVLKAIVREAGRLH